MSGYSDSIKLKKIVRAQATARELLKRLELLANEDLDFGAYASEISILKDVLKKLDHEEVWAS